MLNLHGARRGAQVVFAGGRQYTAAVGFVLQKDRVVKHVADEIFVAEGAGSGELGTSRVTG